MQTDAAATPLPRRHPGGLDHPVIAATAALSSTLAAVGIVVGLGFAGHAFVASFSIEETDAAQVREQIAGVVFNHAASAVLFALLAALLGVIPLLCRRRLVSLVAVVVAALFLFGCAEQLRATDESNRVLACAQQTMTPEHC